MDPWVLQSDLHGTLKVTQGYPSSTPTVILEYPQSDPREILKCLQNDQGVLKVPLEYL